MAEVTEGDRHKAATVLGRVLHSNDHLIGQDIIAAALAEEREKARAPFLALAEEMHDSAKVARDAGDPYWVPLSSIEHFADRIRRAAEEIE